MKYNMNKECKFLVNGQPVKSQIELGDVHLKSYCESNYYFCNGCEFNTYRR